jgi:hypothetical protein
MVSQHNGGQGDAKAKTKTNQRTNPKTANLSPKNVRDPRERSGGKGAERGGKGVERGGKGVERGGKAVATAWIEEGSSARVRTAPDSIGQYRTGPVPGVLAEDQEGQAETGRLEAVVEVIRLAIAYGGRVVLYSERGISRAPAVAAAYLMGVYALTYLEAFAHIVQQRPVAEPNSVLVRVLQEWHPQGRGRLQQRLSIEPSLLPADLASLRSYRCPCGACVVTLPIITEILACMCQVGQASDCPSLVSCRQVSAQQENVYGLVAPRGLLWGYAQTRGLVRELSRLTHAVRYDPFREAGVCGQRGGKQPPVDKPVWQAYECSVCRYLLFAEHTGVTLLTLFTPLFFPHVFLIFPSASCVHFSCRHPNRTVSRPQQAPYPASRWMGGV